MAKKYKKGVEIRLPISKHIDINFRDYALYVLENRGIPSFYDGLTNVQKFILQNAPSNFNKTISLVGDCISAGYHHGDSSVKGAINKLARPFGCAQQMLEGDGFFGTPVNHEAAAPRYTSVKINKDVQGIIKENSFLNSKDEEGLWNSLWTRLPLGLTTTIIGIAVGYKTTILPRSIEDIENYLQGKSKEVIPSFIGFSGKVTRFQNLDRSWLIQGNYKIDQKHKSIHITSLPPMMKYKKFLSKVDGLLTKYEDKFTIKNNSSDDIDMLITFRGRSQDQFVEFTKDIEKNVKMLVTETPVFVKDGSVLVYEKIEDYLDDFKYRLQELELRKQEYYLNKTSFELEFQRAKLDYLKFMLVKKRTEDEIFEFFESYDKKIATRLDTIKLRNLTDKEIIRVKDKIKELEKEEKSLIRLVDKLNKAFDKLIDPTIKRKTDNRVNQTDLFDDSDFEDYDGIEIFGNEKREMAEDLNE